MNLKTSSKQWGLEYLITGNERITLLTNEIINAQKINNNLERSHRFTRVFGEKKKLEIKD